MVRIAPISVTGSSHLSLRVRWLAICGAARGFILILLLALATVSQIVDGTPATAQDLQNSQVDIEYVEPKNSSLRQYYEALKGRHVLEELREFLSPLRFPQKLLVKTEECGRDTLPYQSGKPIIACYEYVARIVKLAPAIKTRTGISRDAAICPTSALVRQIYRLEERRISGSS